MSDNAFLVDTTKCQGCRACQVACKQWNGLPGEKTEFFAGPEFTNPAELSAITWNHVKFFPVDRSDAERPIWTIMHKKCYHCKEANCVAVCPEKAISKVDGWTIIDQSKCIGCGACVNACVYKVPQVSDIEHINDVGQRIVTKDKSHKCNACTLNAREIPACVTTCPSEALTFGNRAVLIQEAKSRLEKYRKTFPKASIYGLDEFGGLRVITILRDSPDKYGLPTGKDAEPMDHAKAEAIKDTYALLSMFTFGIPAFKRTAYKIARSLGTKDA
ncbi:MAG TPA: 4Fe-4S dicluster domain-containing protein [Spirochaetota bacterium]|nr:4Fe-4S dicluster domain-containing protein [Spirochaetota bacterium]HPI91201.1 4Fe-4S dicluster domain-containing protein [Spirochaetota bacterium]HPR47088.1 4Fe-4S dicluster domain-containing protein [Spirochaetota bacterium]